MVVESDLTIALFGGSGATGREVVQQALGRGIAVQGLVRAGSTLGLHGPLVAELTGSLTQEENLDAVLEDADAAILVFGPRPPFEDVFCAEATFTITLPPSASSIPSTTTSTIPSALRMTTIG